jgi:predicted ATPase
MFLRSLLLHHIRMFGELDLSFERAGSPRPFTVILAENGCGKTTLLQAIAIAAAGAASANKLVRDASSYADRRALQSSLDPFHCVMSADFGFDSANSLEHQSEVAGEEALAPAHGIRSHVVIPSASKTFTGHSELLGDLAAESTADVLSRARDTDARGWFVIGYGTSRTLPPPQWFPQIAIRSVDRMQSLFTHTPLIATAFADVLRQQLGDEVARAYSRTLAEVLIGSEGSEGLLPKSIAQGVVGFELRGQGGVRSSSDLIEAERFVVRMGTDHVKLPAVWLSSGFQSTIAWIADLLGHYALDMGRVVAPNEMRGIVLIDELDLHLHPRWQMQLVPALRRIFPRLQFIATTHSPLILTGLQRGEAIVLRASDDGRVEVCESDDDPRLLTASQLLREYFGVEGLYLNAVGVKVRRFEQLAAIAARSDAEQREVEALQSELEALGVEHSAPVERALPGARP